MLALVNGGTFDSATGGTFQSDTDGTFNSDIPGTFESDMGGTFKVLQSDDLSHYLKKAQYYIKLELGVFDSEDFNKNTKQKRHSIKNKLKRKK